MEATYSPETSIDCATRRYIPEVITLDKHRYKNLTSYTVIKFVSQSVRGFHSLGACGVGKPNIYPLPRYKEKSKFRKGGNIFNINTIN
jgi:hypothetical protein